MLADRAAAGSRRGLLMRNAGALPMSSDLDAGVRHSQTIMPKRPPASPAHEAAARHQLKVRQLESMITTLRAEIVSLQSQTSEIQILRDQAHQIRLSKRSTDHQIASLRSLLKEKDEQIASLSNSDALKVGRALLKMRRRRFGIARLAAHMVGVWWRLSTVREKASSPVKEEKTATTVFNEARFRLEQNGLAEALTWVRAQATGDELLARILVEFGRTVRKTNLPQCIELFREAISLDRKASHIKLLAFGLFDDGLLAEPRQLLDAIIQGGAVLTAAELRRGEQIIALDRIRTNGLHVPARYEGVEKKGGPARALVLASQSLPYHKTPASLRAYRTARRLAGLKIETEVVTPPGYPSEEKAQATRRLVEDIGVRLLPPVQVPAELFDLYAVEAAKELQAFGKLFGPQVIVAEWSEGFAAAGLLTARALSVPYVLDIAEIWKPALPHHPGWEATERFAAETKFCALIAAEADCVLSRSRRITDLLIEQGLPAERVRTISDAPEPPKDLAAARASLRSELGLNAEIVLGFVGGPFPFWDLEAVARATVELVANGRDVALLVVGVGRRIEMLAALARDLGIADRVVTVPRPAGSDPARYFAAMDVAIFPSRPSHVVALRAPMEIWQAAAYGCAVVAGSSVDVGDLAGTGGRSVGYDSEDPQGLTRALASLLDDREHLRLYRSDLQRRANEAAIQTKAAFEEMVRSLVPMEVKSG